MTKKEGFILSYASKAMNWSTHVVYLSLSFWT